MFLLYFSYLFILSLVGNLSVLFLAKTGKGGRREEIERMGKKVKRKKEESKKREERGRKEGGKKEEERDERSSKEKMKKREIKEYRMLDV